MAKRTVAANMLVLGLSGIMAKTFDFAFRAYYSRILGTEGMGLLSLGFSLHGVLLTFATAGLGVAVSKTTSEYMEVKNSDAVCGCMRMAVFLVAALSLLVISFTFVFSGYLAETVLGDKRVSVSLCTLVPSVLFMGVSYCIKGCFYAERKVVPPASSEILEQLVKFAAIKILLDIFLPYGTEYGCAAVFGGITVGEFSSCAYLTFFYLRERRGGFGITKNALRGKTVSQRGLACRLLSVSVPSMITSLCCSTLRTKEEVLIVGALKRGGMAHSEALGTLGILYGMVMPLLVLPLTLMGSVMSLLVPEISRAGISGGYRLKRVTLKIYRFGAAAGCIVAVVFLMFGGTLSRIFYNTDKASALVMCLAPLCPIMFIDSLSCSVLNGLGKQLRLLLFSIADFMLRFAIIYFAIPTGKVAAFSLMIAASNVFTCALSCGSVINIVFGRMKLEKRKLTNLKKCGILKNNT